MIHQAPLFFAHINNLCMSYDEVCAYTGERLAHSIYDNYKLSQDDCIPIGFLLTGIMYFYHLK